MLKRMISFILAIALCCSVLSPVVGAADTSPVVETENTAEVMTDGAAFGEWMSGEMTAEVVKAWTDDALSTSEARTLLNSQELHPQRTGWVELDNLIENMLENAGSDTYSKLRYMYDWLVKNVTYSWEGYSNTNASAAAYNSVTGYNYLRNMTYDGYTKTIPDDMANRTYHILTARKGVCYDYAIAIAVVARYIGIESYVHTGRFIFEDTSNGAGHHGWAILVLNGANYVFDPQRDARNYEYYGRNGYYFGIPSNKTSRYQPNYWSADTTANAQRDASLLPVTTSRGDEATIAVEVEGTGTVSGTGSYYKGKTVTLKASPAGGASFGGWYGADGSLLSKDATYTFTAKEDVVITAKFVVSVQAQASRSGKVTGAGDYVVGTTATLTAVPNDGASFDGWYDAEGTRLSSDTSYSVLADANKTLYAMFAGDRFYDIPVNAWYEEDVMEAVDRGMVNGVTPISFCGDNNFTRGMAVVMLARLDGADVSEAAVSPFVDVEKGAWFESAINWAAENGLVNGKDETHFMPDDPIKREEFIAIVVRYIEYKGQTLTGQELSYTDVDEIDEYAVELLEKAQNIGLIEGDPGGTLRPRATLLRSEGTTIMVRLAHYMDSIEEADETEQPEA